MNIQSVNIQSLKKQFLRVLLLGACLAHAAFAQFILSGISPSTGTAGGPAFTITLSGTFVAPPSVAATYGAVFTPSGGAPVTLTVTDTSASEIVATVPAALIELPGTATVFATEQLPKGPPLDSASFPFTIVAPTPIIDSLKPSTTALNGSGLSFAVIGAGYYSASVVQWNGTALTTVFDTAGLLTATVPAGLLTTAGNQLITVSNGPGLVSNQFLFSVSAPIPSISSLSPATVAEGGPAVPLTVTGAGFLGGADCANGGCTISSVTFDGVALATTFVDRSHLTATIPSASLTLGPHTVLVAEGAVVTASLPFEVTALLPSLTALSPVSSVQNAAGFTLTLTGAGFVGPPNCNGTNCLPSHVTFGSSSLSTTFVSGTQLTATVPATLLTAVGSFPVTVVNNGLASSAVSFSVFAPALSSVSPSAAVAGGPAFTITATGVAFQPTSRLTWNGTALATTVVSATQLTATVPAALIAAAGSAIVGVITEEAGGGLTSNSLTFTTVAAVTITSISPSTAAAGSPQLTLTVTGAGFLPGSAVQLNGSPLATTYVSTTSLTAVVPQSALIATGVDSIVVANPASPVAQVSNAVTLTVFQPPVITSLSPSSVSLGAAGFTLTVDGTGFTASSTVMWNGATLVTTLVSATQLTAVVPAALLTAVGTPSVSVSNGPGIISNSLPFQVTTLQPSLTSLSPASSIQSAAGFTLTLTGTGFVGPADCNGTNCSPSRAVFGTTSLPTTFVSRTQLTAAVPASLLTAAGSFPVTVANNALISNAISFSVAVPVLSSLSPASAIAGSPAFTLTVTGTSFLPSSTLTWNGAALATTFVSATQLTAVVPATLLTQPGSASVAVATLTLTSNTLTFAVNLPGPPSLSLSTPSTVGPAQQPTVGFVLNSGYPIPLDGTVTLTFAPNAAVPDDDPAIQFSTGGRTLTFSLAANSTALPALNIQTGTVAGTITLAVALTADGVDVTPPGSTATIVIPRAAPVITSVTLVRAATSVQLNVVGYATSRELIQGAFQFTPSANNTFTSPNITVPLSTPFATWYESAPGASYGSQFMLSQPFSLGGSSDAIASVTVTLQNAVGTSQPATAN
jgi:hypothetical protein